MTSFPPPPYGSAAGPPPPPPRPGPSWRIIVPITAAVVGIALLGTAFALGTSGGSTKTNRVVALEPVSSPVRNPFMPSVGTDVANVTSPTPPSGAGPQRYPGGTPGLYGGTRDNASCDRDRLIAYLEQTPDKAAPWAATLGIQPSQIRSYVATLTTVVLRADTRVTNHGYLNGRPTVIPAVLQAGTAVLVNQYGEPVVKCFCGNPLTPPAPFANPTYTGTPWPTFQPTNITVIVKNTVIINAFTVVDPRTGEAFPRRAGGVGSDGPPLVATTTTTQPSTTTTPTAPATQPDVNGTYTVTVTSTSPQVCTGSTDTWTVRVTGATIDINQGTTNLSGTYNPTDSSFSIRTPGGTEDGRFDPSGGVSGTASVGSGCTGTFTGHKTS
jgi:hypothetical protein